MRINELAERSGVSAASIKYYVREGLLPGGERSGYNQVTYGESHLHRLRLIRVLLDLGHLPIATVKHIVGAVEDPARSLHSTLGTTRQAAPVASVPEVLAAAAALGHADLAEMVADYRAAADRLARLEVAWLDRPATDDRDVLAERAVVGTILGDALLTAIRREAQRTASASRFGTT
ncbi:MerR family transcriptional regulator [Kribbella albertanoniae]|uniref:MerR family transcriptional regulator n=1 Tax=Kribbella albertanoniae TaxID=1266829 RepID=A0A4R4QI32_9ACTN|nr:MerR family transcriptional regulator [Kribbella albertanoniae]TDC35318.1 MerR family transcriptional regulator [Kribbella albertanoniae]